MKIKKNHELIIDSNNHYSPSNRVNRIPHGFSMVSIRCAVLRGNASEILSLSGADGAGKGVDSTKGNSDFVWERGLRGRELVSWGFKTGLSGFICFFFFFNMGIIF